MVSQIAIAKSLVRHYKISIDKKERGGFRLPFQSYVSPTTLRVKLHNLTANLNASDIFWLENERPETIPLKLANLFDVVFRQRERARVDRLFRISRRDYHFFRLHKAVDINIASLFVLFDPLADNVICIGLSV